MQTKIRFETSRGMVGGEILSVNMERGLVTYLIVSGIEHLQAQYAMPCDWVEMDLRYPQWVKVELNDSHDGCPEYKILP